MVRRRTDKEGVREASISSGNPGKLNERERGGQVSRMIETRDDHKPGSAGEKDDYRNRETRGASERDNLMRF